MLSASLFHRVVDSRPQGLGCGLGRRPLRFACHDSDDYQACKEVKRLNRGLGIQPVPPYLSHPLGFKWPDVT